MMITRSMIDTMTRRINGKLKDYGLCIEARRCPSGYEILVINEDETKDTRSMRGCIPAYECWQTLRVMNETLELVLTEDF